MEWIEDGGVLSAAGFRTGAARCGLKTASDQPDVAVLTSTSPARGAGVFTTNRFAAAPVQWCRRLLPSANVRALVVNAGNANACTGERGIEDVHRCAELVAGSLGCRSEQVLTASTGVIGKPLPMDRLMQGIRQACAGLSGEAEAMRRAERAIMTTDTRPKAAAARAEIGGVPFHVGGMAKGAGMIAPHMATMLCFVTTDASVTEDVLESLLREAVGTTFNSITVDGDSSTNDCVIALASGASGASVQPGEQSGEVFGQALRALLGELATQIVRDAEGATRLIRVRIRTAQDDEDARKAARAVAESQLLKCAVYGGDPNWGRIVCALGYSGAQVVP
ncbi:MAG: bifunctional glutamate N-acetyltransferase/amino-acid acetyltransferase ArgJ, partial [Candidatus Brocadiaceae bacterium]